MKYLNIVIILIAILAQISCVNSDIKKRNSMEKCDNLFQYINFQNKKHLNITFLRSFECKENDFVIIVPQERFFLSKRLTDCYDKNNIFDVYVIKSPSSNDGDFINMLLQDCRYDNSNDFNCVIKNTKTKTTIDRSVNIDKPNSEIINDAVHFFCLPNLKIPKNWTKINIVKKSNEIMINFYCAKSYKEIRSYYEYIDHGTPAKKTHEHIYFRCRNTS